MRILLTTEGTYPYFRGGVSTWADALVTGLPEHDFVVGAVIGDPHASKAYAIPPNVRVMAIPLWGAERVREYIDSPHRSFATIVWRSRDRTFEGQFLTAYDEVITHLLGIGDPRRLGVAFADIADYCESHDLRLALRDHRCWELTRTRLAEHLEFRDISLADAIDVARSLFRYLMPLAVTVPSVDVAHSSAAAVCALPALVAKLRTGIPLFVTEHGVYLRERVLQLVHDDTQLLRRKLLTNLYRAIAQCTFEYADAVLPVCSYNSVWERELGVPAERIRTVYNGVDPQRFPSRQVRLARPTISYVGRLEPLKDVLGLIAATNMIRHTVPDVLLRIHGPDSDPGYAARCRSAVAAAHLDNHVVFEGPTREPARAYQESHVVALSSISEGFPYTVVEAMMSRRPVVATAVGGVPEALGDTTLLVEPQSPRSLADRLDTLLRCSPAERAAIAERLRARAERLFSRARFLDTYRELYRDGLTAHVS